MEWIALSRAFEELLDASIQQRIRKELRKRDALPKGGLAVHGQHHGLQVQFEVRLPDELHVGRTVWCLRQHATAAFGTAPFVVQDLVALVLLHVAIKAIAPGPFVLDHTVDLVSGRAGSFCPASLGQYAQSDACDLAVETARCYGQRQRPRSSWRTAKQGVNDVS